MEPTPLQLAWFLLFFVLIAGYAVLDGFARPGGARILLSSEVASEGVDLQFSLGELQIDGKIL